jgi:uncharacterized UBP type Zn finger protein
MSKLVKEMWTLEEQYDFLKPTFFHKLISKKFEATLQHDAHEYLIFMLSHL